MQFKLFSRNALRLGAFLLTISLAACSDPPAQKPVEEDPGRPTNSVLPKNMTDQPKNFNDYGYGESPVDLCEYINQKCKVDQPTNSAKWLGCVNVDPNTPDVGVCRTLCSDTMRCSSNPDSCVPWKSPAGTEPSKVAYTGYCTSSGSECKGYFDTKSCGDKKRCIADPKIPKRFVCGEAGTKALGAACTETSECEADAVCAQNLDGKDVCTKVCLSNEKVLDIVGDTAAETAELRAPYVCGSGNVCLFSENANVLAAGIGLCMSTVNFCQPGQVTCLTQAKEHGVCITSEYGSFCKHFPDNDGIGTKRMFEVCDENKPCTAGLVCAAVNNDGQNYCVQPCNDDAACGQLGSEKRTPGKNSSYMCLGGLIPGATKATPGVPSIGYCVLNCAADQYGKKCKEGADTSLKSDAYCTLSEFNRDNDLQILSGAFCLGRSNSTAITAGDVCKPKTEFCEDGYTCIKANPSAADFTCEPKVVCQSDGDCVGGKKCNFGTFTANTEKGNKLGICRKPCTPDADYLDKNNCNGNEQRCVQVGLDSDGKQFTFCSDSTGTKPAGEKCTLERISDKFPPAVSLVFPAAHPIKDDCEPSLTCVTGADTGDLGQQASDAVPAINNGVCRKRCHLLPTPSGCGADEVCSIPSLGSILEHVSPANVSVLTPICVPAVTGIKDTKHGGFCTEADNGKACASGSVCRKWGTKEYRCLDLCKEDTDCKRPSSYTGELKCLKSPGLNLGSEWGICQNFNDE